MADRVGVIGTGVMGGAMARRLFACGFDVAVFDANFQAMSPLADLGAVLKSGPRAIADCSDIIVCSLPSAEISIGVAACEGLALAQRAGIGMQLMLDILNSGSGSNWATRQMLPNTLVAGRPSGPISITVKDLGFYLAEAETIGGAVPVSRDLMERLQSIVAQGDPQRDTTALFSYFVQLADSTSA